jgi:prenyl protein peptidase
MRSHGRACIRAWQKLVLLSRGNPDQELTKPVKFVYKAISANILSFFCAFIVRVRDADLAMTMIEMMNGEITLLNAVILSSIHTLLYVGVLYVREASRPSPTKHTLHPSVIKARTIAICVAVALSIALNRYVLEVARKAGQQSGIPGWDNTLEGWGEWQLDLRQTWSAFFLTATLFFGSLVERLWLFEGWKDILPGTKESMTTWIGWRSYIIVCLLSQIDIDIDQGPFSEEVVFRGCIVPLFLIAGVSPLTTIFSTPLFFGLGTLLVFLHS